MVYNDFLDFIPPLSFSIFVFFPFWKTCSLVYQYCLFLNISYHLKKKSFLHLILALSDCISFRLRLELKGVWWFWHLANAVLFWWGFYLNQVRMITGDIHILIPWYHLPLHYSTVGQLKLPIEQVSFSFFHSSSSSSSL